MSTKTRHVHGCKLMLHVSPSPPRNEKLHGKHLLVDVFCLSIRGARVERGCNGA